MVTERLPATPNVQKQKVFGHLARSGELASLSDSQRPDQKQDILLR
ncbi:hypothetical protein A2U01_0082534, partial [Trifolium medium]|nr:hypothetical protein [Trifolium medium]